MKINSDINVLGGLPDFDLVNYFLFQNNAFKATIPDHYTYTAIKTDESVRRFERAILGTLIKFKSENIKDLIKSVLLAESTSPNSMLFLFWNASVNNELLHYLNSKVYFPAFYSGRFIIKKEEASACIIELKETEPIVRDWSIGTVETVGRKYLTLLKKFNLLEGSLNKKIVHPYLSDKMFVLFIYWLNAIEQNTNLLKSDFIKYCFCEHQVFLERVLHRKFLTYFDLTYTGDKLKIETSIPYIDIYDAVK